MALTLCGDIGGTNTRLSLFEVSEAAPSGSLLFNNSYLNSGYKSFNELYSVFIADAGETRCPVTACFAVAGPVKNNCVVFTNRDQWTIDGDSLSKTLGIQKIRLINDFVANGYGLLTLDLDKECRPLQENPRISSAPIVCIGAGTGLGECFLTPDQNGNYQCFPSEGGHAEFAPRNALENDLLNFLKAKFDQQHRVSVERVVSGTGLANVR